MLTNRPWPRPTRTTGPPEQRSPSWRTTRLFSQGPGRRVAGGFDSSPSLVRSCLQRRGAAGRSAASARVPNFSALHSMKMERFQPDCQMPRCEPKWLGLWLRHHSRGLGSIFASRDMHGVLCISNRARLSSNHVQSPNGVPAYSAVMFHLLMVQFGPGNTLEIAGIQGPISQAEEARHPWQYGLVFGHLI